MKKILLVMAALLIGMMSYAQRGIGVGYANSMFNGESVNGLTVAAMTDFPVGAPMAVITGVEASCFVSTQNLIGADAIVHDVYVTVPVRLAASLSLSKNFNIIPYAGPAFNVGIIDRADVKSTLIESKTNFDLYEYQNISRFDVLVGGGVIFDFGYPFFFDFGYDYGLLQRYENNENHRQVMHFGVYFDF